MEDASVDLILTDPPYFRVKGEAWDRQWDSEAAFLGWMGELCREWRRLLKPNGTLYVFASPRMAGRVEAVVGNVLRVLSHVVWDKTDEGHRGKSAGKESLRSWWPASERIICAEQFGADGMARGDSGYSGACDKARGFVFEPLRAYLDGERRRAGVSREAISAATETSTMQGHWFGTAQWQLPTAKHYAALRLLFNANGGDYLRREYEDLRREYEDLRREYEDLRRPFFVTADVQYTDVWRFAPVTYYPGKHPCEKPQDLLRHIITASSRPGALVLDCFAGTGSTGLAAMATGRNAVLVEKCEKYLEAARVRLAAAGVTTADERKPAQPPAADWYTGLFAQKEGTREAI
jgi:site-specific DNA-methyltransferase (adenine-specific)